MIIRCLQQHIILKYFGSIISKTGSLLGVGCSGSCRWLVCLNGHQLSFGGIFHHVPTCTLHHDCYMSLKLLRGHSLGQEGCHRQSLSLRSTIPGLSAHIECFHHHSLNSECVLTSQARHHPQLFP